VIYVTLGTMFLGFHRLVRAADAIAADTDEQVVVQCDQAVAPPRYAAWFRCLPHGAVLELQRHARVVVAHAGIGATLDALHTGRPLILVPRLKRYGEHMNDHQLDIAEAVARRGWGRAVRDVADLKALCTAPPAPPRSYTPARAPLLEAVRAMVDRVAAEKGGRR
jgi:beta-1,4-N-acetylglucosaminyltransferase